jgi:hypothetical protein
VLVTCLSHTGVIETKFVGYLSKSYECNREKVCRLLV